jgi:hypothetical protein
MILIDRGWQHYAEGLAASRLIGELARDDPAQRRLSLSTTAGIAGASECRQLRACSLAIDHRMLRKSLGSSVRAASASHYPTLSERGHLCFDARWTPGDPRFKQDLTGH